MLIWKQIFASKNIGLYGTEEVGHNGESNETYLSNFM